MPIVSEYAARTPAERAFAAMLEDYDVALPDVESFFDPMRCPPEMLPYLAQSYYADTYSETLGAAYNRRAIATSAHINAVRGCWGAALQVARNANVLAYVEYRRGPGLVVDLKLAAQGAGRIGNVKYGRVFPARAMLPGGVLFRALEIPASGDTIILHGEGALDIADWPDDRYAIRSSVWQVGSPLAEFPTPLTSEVLGGSYGLIAISGSTITITLTAGDVAVLRTRAAAGADITLTIRPGSLPGVTDKHYAPRRNGWVDDYPLRNTGVNVILSPLAGVASTDYQQAMAHILDRILPYRVTAADVRQQNPLAVTTAPVAMPCVQFMAYTGY